MSNFAFIDAQNLHLGIRSQGWHLDYRKFRLYLKNKYKISEAFMFIGYVPANQALYTTLEKAGFALVFKPSVIRHVNGHVSVKGNVDAELVLHAAAIEYGAYDKAVIVTNDGDFYCLAEFLMQRCKLLKVIAPNNRYSSLFRRLSGYVATLEPLREQLGNKETGIGVRSKP
ncbi:MAG: NYN domain-containing protein [Coriobacteriaceae bacterium]|jgi:uncharacterized LabA/DUF88 family protein|nr:NYN domain-containing protein [Coriobacteriaceae bacterium]